MSDFNIDFGISYGGILREWHISVGKSCWFALQKSVNYKIIKAFDENDDTTITNYFVCSKYENVLNSIILLQHFFTNSYSSNADWMKELQRFLDLILVATEFFPFDGIIDSYEDKTPIEFKGHLALSLG